MRWSGRRDFSSRVNFTGCLSPVYLQPARGGALGRAGWIFSGGANFIGRLHPICLAQNWRERNALVRDGWIFRMDLILQSAVLRRVCANRRGRNALGRAGWIFLTDLILPSACIRRVWCKTVRGGCVGAGGMDFPMDLILPSACIRRVWRKKARGECVGAGEMDFSGGVTFAVRRPPA